MCAFSAETRADVLSADDDLPSRLLLRKQIRARSSAHSSICLCLFVWKYFGFFFAKTILSVVCVSVCVCVRGDGGGGVRGTVMMKNGCWRRDGIVDFYFILCAILLLQILDKNPKVVRTSVTYENCEVLFVGVCLCEFRH